MSNTKTRKPRGPNRPPLAATVSATVVEGIPDAPGRRTKWTSFIEQAQANAGQWVKVGPFYRDTAMGARHRLSETPGLEVEVRHDDAEISYVYLRASA
jgi:hypothetical protein